MLEYVLIINKNFKLKTKIIRFLCFCGLDFLLLNKKITSMKWLGQLVNLMGFSPFFYNRFDVC